jgi:hypothetical protein
MAERQRNKQDEPQAEAPAIFMPAQLIAGAAHFGTTPEVMTGALYGVTDGITREDAKKRLEEFLTKPVGAKKGE